MDIIGSAILGVIAVLCFYIAYRQYKQKGFIFTNKWLYASKKEREEIDERIKKSEYRVGRNVFLGIGFLFIAIAVYSLSSISWLMFIIIALIVILCVYAIVQYVQNSRLYNSMEERNISNHRN